MNELTERQKYILTLVIHEYTLTAAPVGSQQLVQNYRLNLSSATVRSELAALTELGYLRQPHTSAGRVPSEEGYRYFVGRLLQLNDLPALVQQNINMQFYENRHDVDQWMPLAASVLAHMSSAAALITAPHPVKALFKHIELIATRGRQVLMVLVLMGGEIHQRLLSLEEVVSQEQFSLTAQRISVRCQGKDADSLQAVRSNFEGLEQDILDIIVDEMRISDSSMSGEVYIDGLTNVLAEPEFSDSEEARRALHVLEERPLLQNLLAHSAVLHGNIGGVQVLIGGEGTHEELRQCSVILSRYGAPGLATGALGILGPIRMPYARSISTVRFVSSLLSNLVKESLVDS